MLEHLDFSHQASFATYLNVFQQYMNSSGAQFPHFLPPQVPPASSTPLLKKQHQSVPAPLPPQPQPQQASPSKNEPLKFRPPRQQVTTTATLLHHQQQETEAALDLSMKNISNLSKPSVLAKAAFVNHVAARQDENNLAYPVLSQHQQQQLKQFGARESRLTTKKATASSSCSSRSSQHSSSSSPHSASSSSGGGAGSASSAGSTSRSASRSTSSSTVDSSRRGIHEADSNGN